MDNLFTNILNRLKGAREEAKQLQKTSGDRWASLNLKKGIDASIIIVTEEINNFKQSDKYKMLQMYESFLKEEYDIETKRVDKLSYRLGQQSVMDSLFITNLHPPGSITVRTDNKVMKQYRDDVIDEFACACKDDTMMKTFGLRECDVDRIAAKLKDGDTDE